MPSASTMSSRSAWSNDFSTVTIRSSLQRQKARSGCDSNTRTPSSWKSRNKRPFDDSSASTSSSSPRVSKNAWVRFQASIVSPRVSSAAMYWMRKPPARAAPPEWPTARRTRVGVCSDWAKYCSAHRARVSPWMSVMPW